MASLNGGCFRLARDSRLKAPQSPDVRCLGPQARIRPRLGFLFTRRAPARLILFLAQHLSGFQIDQMHPRAGDARK